MSLSAYAQHQYDVWQFGYYAGLDFSGGFPSASTAPFYTDEGSSMWCNPTTGKLMFATDGRVVYQNNGAVMPNGVGLRGGPSSSSSALILPFPSEQLDTVKQFYVFCIGDQSWLDEAIDDSSLTYNVVDFTVNPSGEATQTNVVLMDGLAEKLVATQHCDGEAFWVVVHARSEPTFYAYKVDASGIQSPVVSKVGRQLKPRTTNVRGGPYGQGLMSFSTSGKKLAMAVPFSYSVETFDFDTYTGVVSNAVTIDSVSRTYGVCFSPSGNLLYTVEWVPGNEAGPPVRQFDLTTSQPTTIVGRLIDDDLDFHLGGIQLGPDGRIWLAESNSLACILNPDVAGMGCGLNNGRIPLLSTSRIVVGLPNLITSFFDTGLRRVCAPPIAAMDVDTVVCMQACINPQDKSRNVPTSWVWHFEGGMPSSFTGPKPPSICYDTAGTFSITLYASNTFGVDTVVQRIRVVPPPIVSAGPDIQLCDSTSDHLHASGAVRYEWEYQQGIGNTTSADPIVRVFKNTTFVVRGWNAEGCSATDTVQVFAFPEGKPAATLRTTPVHGLVGGIGTLSVVRDSSMLFAAPMLIVHIPLNAMMDVRVVAGQELGRVRLPSQELAVTAQAASTASDTILQLQGTLLLFKGTEFITTEAITRDSCERFVVDPAAVSAEVCGKQLRGIQFNEELLSIGSYMRESRAIPIFGTKDSEVNVVVSDVTGRQLLNSHIVLVEGQEYIALPTTVRGCCIVQVRTLLQTLSKLVVID